MSGVSFWPNPHIPCPEVIYQYYFSFFFLVFHVVPPPKAGIIPSILVGPIIAFQISLS